MSGPVPICEADGPIDEDIKCSVCLDSWSKPLVVKPCDHVFCRHCVRDMNKCPECRGPITSFELPHRFMLKHSESVQVRCIECDATMSRAESYAHSCKPASVKTDAEVAAAQAARQGSNPAGATAAAPAAPPPTRAHPARSAGVEVSCQTAPQLSSTSGGAGAGDAGSGSGGFPAVAEAMRMAQYKPQPAAIVSEAHASLVKGFTNPPLGAAPGSAEEGTKGGKARTGDVAALTEELLALGAGSLDGAATAVTPAQIAATLGETKIPFGCKHCSRGVMGRGPEATTAHLHVTCTDCSTSFGKSATCPKCQRATQWHVELKCDNCNRAAIRPYAAGDQLQMAEKDSSTHKFPRCDCTIKRESTCNSTRLRFTGCTHSACTDCLWTYASRRGAMSPHPPVDLMFVRDPCSIYDESGHTEALPAFKCPVCAGLGLTPTECGRLDSARWGPLIDVGNIGLAAMARKAIEIVGGGHSCAFCGQDFRDGSHQCRNCQAQVCELCDLPPNAGCIHIAEPSAADVAVAMRGAVLAFAAPQCAECRQPLSIHRSATRASPTVKSATVADMQGLCYSCGGHACLLCGAKASKEGTTCCASHLEMVRRIAGELLLGDATKLEAADLLVAVTAIRAIAIGRGFFSAFFASKASLADRYPVAALQSFGFPLFLALRPVRPLTSTGGVDPMVALARTLESDSEAVLWRVARLPERERNTVRRAGLKIFMMPDVIDDALAPVVAVLGASRVLAPLRPPALH
jgi:hypothetical protein